MRSLVIVLLVALNSALFGQESKDTTKPDTIPYYFPLKAFTDKSSYVGHEAFVVTWYSKHLFALKEPILFNKVSSTETYRFTWLRTFDSPVVVRIEKTGDQYILYWKQSDGAGGYEPGTITIDTKKNIDKHTWDTFHSKLKEIHYWELPTIDTEREGLDGSQWILEGKVQKKYHVVDRWSPDKENAYFQLCDYLLSLTDLTIEKDNKY